MGQSFSKTELINPSSPTLHWLPQPIPADQARPLFHRLYGQISGHQENDFLVDEATKEPLIEGLSELLWVLANAFEPGSEVDARLKRAYHCFFAYFTEVKFNVNYPHVGTIDQVQPTELIQFFTHDFDKLGQFYQRLDPQETALTEVVVLLLDYLLDITQAGAYLDIPAEIVAKLSELVIGDEVTTV